MAVLNSRISQFIFEKEFNSIKILRSHLEFLPIPIPTKEIESTIIELVNQLIKEDKKDIIEQLYNKIDIIICNLFDLTQKEYKTIIKSLKKDRLFLY
jgi:hypothetical protein